MGLKRDEWYWFEDKETGRLSEDARYRSIDGLLCHAGTPKFFDRKKEAQKLCARSERVVKVKIVKVEA